MYRRSSLYILPLILAIPSSSEAQLSLPWPVSDHFQFTVIEQGHSSFRSMYSGPNSLRPVGERAASLTSTLFLGLQARPGTEFYFDPEITGGTGVSNSVGMAGYPNGEIFRVGSPQPFINDARIFVRQTFGLGGGSQPIADGPNQVAGTLDKRRITLIAGKFALPDIFDNNTYSHDPRSQFLNWALMDSAAWDYPADTRGYTWGAAGEYRDPLWALRLAAAMEPREANQISMDSRFGRAHGFAGEIERDYAVGSRKGAARTLVFLNEARMGSYSQALNSVGTPNIIASRAYGRTKYGFAVSADQELADGLGGFTRLSWDDGRNETWAFTEVDRSLAVGLSVSGARWNRGQDTLASAVVINGLSGLHRNYLAAGGTGFMVGDGAMHYGPETILETYYRMQASSMISLAPDYQFVVNPAYNRARGPVSIFALRFHLEF